MQEIDLRPLIDGSQEGRFVDVRETVSEDRWYRI